MRIKKPVMPAFVTLLELKLVDSRDKIKLATGSRVRIAEVHYITLVVCDVNRLPPSVIFLRNYSLVSLLLYKKQWSLQYIYFFTLFTYQKVSSQAGSKALLSMTLPPRYISVFFNFTCIVFLQNGFIPNLVDSYSISQ